MVSDDDAKMIMERGRGRFEKINWPVYDSIHQKFIAIGKYQVKF